MSEAPVLLIERGVKIEAYPVCRRCNAAFVLRRAWLVTSGEMVWIWQRDCRHKWAKVDISNDHSNAEPVDGGDGLYEKLAGKYGYIPPVPDHGGGLPGDRFDDR